MKKKQIIQSANFKRDYVAFSAVLIFFLIVIAEVALAISIPAYLTRENVLAVQVRRLQLLNSFDALRNYVRSIPANENGKKELQLVSWNLNQLADYLRENSGKLTSNEIAELQEVVNEFRKVATVIAHRKSYTAEISLNTVGYVNGVLKEETQK